MHPVARFTFALSLVIPLLVSCCAIPLLDSLNSEIAQEILVCTVLGLAAISPLYSAVYCAFRLDRSTPAKVGCAFIFTVAFYTVQWAVFYTGCSASGGYL